MTDPLASRRHAAPGASVHWGAEDLWLALEPLLPGLSIEVVQSAGSTNSALAERLRDTARLQPDRRGGRVGDLSPQLLVAIRQTAGRGRLGRRWHSTPGSSLTFSLALPLRRADWSGLSLAVGVAVADALDVGGGRIGLKWPNDLVLREPDAAQPARKLGGILIESVGVGELRAAVIGIGINVIPQPVAEADYGAAALTELWPDATPQAALGRLAGPLVRALVAFERDGFAPLQPAYARRDVLRGQRVRTTDAALPDGLAAGVDVDGALMVDVDGQAHRVVSGEVSVRLAAAS